MRAALSLAGMGSRRPTPRSLSSWRQSSLATACSASPSIQTRCTQSPHSDTAIAPSPPRQLHHSHSHRRTVTHLKTTLLDRRRSILPTKPVCCLFLVSHLKNSITNIPSGSFEIYATGGPQGNVMRQSVPIQPILWTNDFAPYSVIGDAKWSDTVVSVQVFIEVD